MKKSFTSVTNSEKPPTIPFLELNSDHETIDWKKEEEKSDLREREREKDFLEASLHPIHLSFFTQTSSLPSPFPPFAMFYRTRISNQLRNICYYYFLFFYFRFWSVLRSNGCEYSTASYPLIVVGSLSTRP